MDIRLCTLNLGTDCLQAQYSRRQSADTKRTYRSRQDIAGQFCIGQWLTVSRI